MDGGIVAEGLIVDLVLLKRIIECNGVPKSKWVTSIVILHDANIIAVA
jgi:hypothetical protein